MFVPILLLLLLAVVVVMLLLYFGNWRTYPWYVQATCFVSWLFPFSIIVMLPLDLASTLYRHCKESSHCEVPFAYVTEDFLLVFWKIVYWTMFNLTWYFIPVMQSWVRSGDFHPWPRLYNSIKENIIYYAVLGVIGIIFLLYIIFTLKFSQMGELMDFLMAGANAWGLLLSTFMLGYGLVEIPRSLWYNASTRWALSSLELQAPKAKEAVVDSEAELYEVAKDIAVASKRIGSGNPLRVYVDKLLEKCPLAMDERVSDEDRENTKETTLDDLKSLNSRIGWALMVHDRHQAQYRFLLTRAWMLSDVIENEQNDTKVFSFKLTKAPVDSIGIYKMTAAWWWFIWIKPISMRCLSVLCIVASCALIWSESTFQFRSALLSIPAVVMDLKLSYAAVELVSISFLLYMCTAAYSVMFQIKLFDYYVMVPEHHTDENSLLFVGAYLCRLTFPLCYNFLNMAGLADDDEASAFVQIQGKSAKLTPLLGAEFSEWVPQLVLIFSLITLLNLYDRILSFFRIKNNFYLSVSKSTAAADLSEGRDIIAQARAAEERRIARLEYDGRDLTSQSGSVSTGRPGSRATNTQELLAKYKSRGHGSQFAASAGESSRNDRSRVQPIDPEEGVTLNRESPVLLPKNFTPLQNFSLKSSVFKKSSSTSGSISRGATSTTGVGAFQRLPDPPQAPQVKTSPQASGRMFGKSNDNSPARNGAGTSRQTASGSSNENYAASWPAGPGAIQPVSEKKSVKATRNIFDDV